MFCLVYSISRHGLSKDITDFVFEWETTKNSGQSTQFFGFGKDMIYNITLKVSRLPILKLESIP
jgi:hypothetical protein